MMFTSCRKLMFRISNRQMQLPTFGMASASGIFLLESLAFFFSPRFSGSVLRFVFDSSGRILIVLIQIGEVMVNIVNI